MRRNFTDSWTKLGFLGQMHLKMAQKRFLIVHCDITLVKRGGYLQQADAQLRVGVPQVRLQHSVGVTGWTSSQVVLHSPPFSFGCHDDEKLQRDETVFNQNATDVNKDPKLKASAAFLPEPRT